MGEADGHASSEDSDDSANEDGFGVNMAGGMRVRELDNDLEVYNLGGGSDEENEFRQKGGAKKKDGVNLEDVQLELN